MEVYKQCFLRELAKGKSPAHAADSKKGMSALQIMRYMGFGSYKTAWEMCRKIRVALMEDIEKLGGIVGRGSPKATLVGAMAGSIRRGNGDEAHRRAVEGVKRPVFRGGKKVGEITEYSDFLLGKLLRRRRGIWAAA